MRGSLSARFKFSGAIRLGLAAGFLAPIALAAASIRPACADPDGNQIINLTLPANSTGNSPANGAPSGSNTQDGASSAGWPESPTPTQAAPDQLPQPDFNHLSVIAIGTVNQDGAQIVRRAGPAGVQILFTCQNGQNIGIAGQIGAWYCVMMADQTLGCIPVERVALNWQRPGQVPDGPAGRSPRSGVPAVIFPGTPHDGSATGAELRIVDEAMHYLGVRYRWGGNTFGGIDCSGLVKNVFHAAGINLPRTAREQAQVGEPVALADIQPGDRLSFACHGSTIDHTGIYIGNGQFIHASGSKSEVCITPLESYVKWLAGIHRDIS